MSEPQQQIVPHIIIPCAGEGKRFKEQGYTDPKPLIPVGRRLMLDWVLDVVPNGWRSNIIAVIRDDNASALQDQLWDWVWDGDWRSHSPIRSCMIPGPTQGAACSVLAAAVGLPPDEPVIVLNSDQYIQCDLQAIHDKAIAEGWDGFVLTFENGGTWPGPAWSYAVTDHHGERVIRVVEKPGTPIPKSAATVGLYWWRRADHLVRSICTMIATNQTTNGEYYLAPAYNAYNLATHRVYAVPVEEFHGLGTPEQVRAFEQHLAARTQPELAGVGA